MEDGILELSDSSFINPLTIVHQENKEPRFCIEARRENNVTLPDRVRTPPIDEMLQQFHGVKYMTSLDLTSAFLQIPLEASSRKYTVSYLILMSVNFSEDLSERKIRWQLLCEI